MKYDLSGGVSRSAGRVFKAFRAALFELLQRQSFESISVQTLCNAANYPRSTFYNYFEDIYDLLDFCLQTPIHGFEGKNTGRSLRPSGSMPSSPIFTTCWQSTGKPSYMCFR